MVPILPNKSQTVCLLIRIWAFSSWYLPWSSSRISIRVQAPVGEQPQLANISVQKIFLNNSNKFRKISQLHLKKHSLLCSLAKFYNNWSSSFSEINSWMITLQNQQSIRKKWYQVYRSQNTIYEKQFLYNETKTICVLLLNEYFYLP